MRREVKEGLLSATRAIIIRQPIAGHLQRDLFAGTAMLLFLGDVVVLVSARPGDRVSLEWSFGCCVMLALAGWLPATGGVLYVLAATAAAAMPNDMVSISLAYLGIFAVAADWIARKWIMPGVSIALAVECVRLLRSPTPLVEIVGGIVGLVFSVTLGAVIHWNAQRLARARSETEEARRNAEAAESKIRLDLKVHLHDSVAAQLGRSIQLADAVTRAATDPDLASKGRALGESTRMAMQNLRALMADGRCSQDHNTVAATVWTCRTMLAGRDIILDASVPDAPDDAVDPTASELLQAVVREGSANALKYATEHSTVHLTIEDPANGSVSLAMTSRIDTDSGRQADPLLSGGVGLAMLSRQARELGGRVMAGKSGPYWLLTASVPVRPRSQEEHA
ncbi:sensor histidine kinase [Schaalia naturae]|uniref:Sensor histidine kinase n=1 Tax=Schaalia naturae TaxID=635203 RepID=A0ABW2SKI8_9ACTO